MKDIRELYFCDFYVRLKLLPKQFFLGRFKKKRNLNQEYINMYIGISCKFSVSFKLYENLQVNKKGVGSLI